MDLFHIRSHKEQKTDEHMNDLNVLQTGLEKKMVIRQEKVYSLFLPYPTVYKSLKFAQRPSIFIPVKAVLEALTVGRGGDVHRGIHVSLLVHLPLSTHSI